MWREWLGHYTAPLEFGPSTLKMKGDGDSLIPSRTMQPGERLIALGSQLTTFILPCPFSRHQINICVLRINISTRY